LLLQGSGEVVHTEKNKSQGSKAGSVIPQGDAELVLSASTTQGFSLVELLVVMAVLLIV
jgi:prepilin-type N-terminal cleavage/methylation domain-containing protein